MCGYVQGYNQYNTIINTLTDKEPTDPTWIGAWWLGYILIGSLLFIALLPVFFYPKYIIHPSKRSLKAKQKYKADSTFSEQVKEFPRALLKLLKNRAYLCMLCTGTLGLYVITGIFMNTPRYIEIHFIQPAFKANIGAAMPGISGVFGGFLGGVIMTKFKFTPLQNSKLIWFAILITTCGLGINMFITCPQVQPAGDLDTSNNRLSVDTSCNNNCSCTTTKNTYHPVCGHNELTYFSPCHAGCSQYEQLNETLIYTNCACLNGNPVGDGQCQEPCHKEFLIFASVFLVMSLLSSLGRVPGTVLQLRIVGDEDGSFALGITSFIINLLVFIPGPIFFGLIIDSTCILWQEECGKTGSCLIYDTDRFRLLIFGISMLFQIGSLIMGLLLVISVSKMNFGDKEEITNDSIIMDSEDYTSQKELIQERITGL